MSAKEIINQLEALGDPDIAEHSQRFFKTGKGQYGEGDVFIGIRVPVLRKQVKQFLSVDLKDVTQLLESPIHEVRLFALLLLAERYKKAGATEQEAIFNLYKAHTLRVNNWDLVDSSAPYIVGAYLQQKDKSLLYEWVVSSSLWERRIAIVATFHFIRNNQFDDTLKLSEMLLQDKEDLMHKAVGWMLREVGKRDESTLKTFLKQHYQVMPRTMLRYAIEKFPETERKSYLQGLI
ncbi:DNA alkylation repair protein [Hydrogenovibrio kuenenii]|uniref:DNA alkylation repair protein n=1 Tax=Hydrogenovibrio kuenenii TaxID=63658 RepID=UPI000464F5E3|nr:DNA alkylation repair protein [Hydrogenovibrio kuenenii]